jgi:glucose-6-phosphate 1-dehydrogenase
MDIKLRFMAKRPGLEIYLNPAEMIFNYDKCSTQTPEAYETLLLDALKGDSTLFMRSDQIEEAWEVITPVQEVWESRDSLDFANYAAGTWGPEGAEAMVARHGHVWAADTVV